MKKFLEIIKELHELELLDFYGLEVDYKRLDELTSMRDKMALQLSIKTPSSQFYMN